MKRLRKSEEERLEAKVIGSLRSPLTFEVKRAEQRIVRRAEEFPSETVTVLLRNYEHEDERVRLAVRETLTEIVRHKEGMAAVLEEMVHPSRSVRKAVQAFLGTVVGAHAVTYASFYEQTMLLVAMAKRKDVPVEDIVSLAELTKQTFMSGEVMEAVQDIGFCLDHIKHRYRGSEQLKEYIADLLKLAPDLSRMGVYSSTIEGPLRKAMKASRYRSYDDTRDLIEERSAEARLRAAMVALGEVVRESVNKRPRMRREELLPSDLALLEQLRGLVDTIASLVLAGRRGEAIAALAVFMEATTGTPGWKERVTAKEPAALFTAYNLAVVCVKLASSIMSATAEDVYQKNLRHLEGEPSIHVVMWPAAVMDMVEERMGLETTAAPAEATNS